MKDTVESAQIEKSSGFCHELIIMHLQCWYLVDNQKDD